MLTRVLGIVKQRQGTAEISVDTLILATKKEQQLDPESLPGPWVGSATPSPHGLQTASYVTCE